MRKFLGKSILISMITLLSSLIIAAAVGFISRNTLGSLNVDSVLLRLNEDKKVNDYIGVLFGIECLAILSFLVLSIDIKSHDVNKFTYDKCSSNELLCDLVINNKVLNIHVNNIPLRI